MIFRPIPVYFQMISRIYFQSIMSIFSLVIYRGFAFSWFLYIQRVTQNPGFSVYSADRVCICVYMCVLFLDQYPLFLDDLHLPTLFLDEIQAIFRKNSPSIFSPIFSPGLIFRPLVRFQFRSLAIQSKRFLVFGWIVRAYFILYRSK